MVSLWKVEGWAEQAGPWIGAGLLVPAWLYPPSRLLPMRVRYKALEFYSIIRLRRLTSDPPPPSPKGQQGSRCNATARHVCLEKGYVSRSADCGAMIHRRYRNQGARCESLYCFCVYTKIKMHVLRCNNKCHVKADPLICLCFYA